jgi:hypothetical protein
VIVTRLEAATLAAAAILIGIQLFTQPLVGMADNGDFSKVAGRLCMGPTEPMLPVRYWFFNITEYEVAARHCLEYWQWSSMSLIAWLAKQTHDVVGRESTFDIRALGAVCSVLWLMGIWGLLRLLRPAPAPVRIAAAVIAVVVLTDVFFVAYFHSFYGDCAAMIFLFATCLGAWRAAQRPTWISILAFAAGGCLLVWSKGPHALVAPWLVAFAAWGWWRSGAAAWIWSAAIIAAATAASLTAVPAGYGAATTFNVVFNRLVPTAADPVPVLAEFDLPPEAAKYSGEYVYTPTTPFNDPSWRARYDASLTPRRLLRFYARNPEAAVDSLWWDLKQSAHMRLFAYYLNRSGERTKRPVRPLLGWSDLRSFLIRSAPLHLPLFYAAVLAGGWFIWRGPAPWQRMGGALVLAFAGAAITEFVVASLFDVLETQRHLFLFHVLTDLLIVHAVLATAWLVSSRLEPRGKVSS